MSKLEQVIEQIGAHRCIGIQDCEKEWQWLYQQQAAFFDKVLANKPETQPTQHLLGLATKVHIETVAQVESHLNSAQAMRKALSENLGEHGQRFQYQDAEQLLFITHLWLYVQGHSAMDFSLANDHASHTAQLLASLSTNSEHEIRSAFMASFYQGKQTAGIADTPSGPLGWIKKLFN